MIVMVNFNFTRRDLGYLLIIFSLFMISVSYSYQAFSKINEIALGLPSERILSETQMFLNNTLFSAQIPTIILAALVIIGLVLIILKAGKK